MELKKIIPPLMRGLSFDGEKGAHIVFEASKKNDAVILQVPEKEEDIATALKEVCGKGNVCPPVYVKDTGTFIPVYQKNLTSYRSHINGKVFIITGGAQGFGAGIVKQVAEEGGNVVIADLNKETARRLADELNSSLKREAVITVQTDVTSEDSVISMIDAAVAWKGGIDVFISNAGVLRAGSVKEMDEKTFRFVTDVNYTAFFLCVKHVSGVMALQNSITVNYFTDIIQINSKSGLAGSNKNAAYAGGKFGSLGLTQSFALELISDCIKVNAVCPGNFFDGPLWSDPENGLFIQYLKTGKVKGALTVNDVKKYYESQVPMSRGCHVDDVVKAIYYIIEQKYETGQAVPVTGGQIMLK